MILNLLWGRAAHGHSRPPQGPSRELRETLQRVHGRDPRMPQPGFHSLDSTAKIPQTGFHMQDSKARYPQPTLHNQDSTAIIPRQSFNNQDF